MSKAVLTFSVYQGDAFLRRETVTQDIVKVGRDPRSHLRIDDEAASRMHAVVEVAGPEDVTLIDLGNEPGTLVVMPCGLARLIVLTPEPGIAKVMESDPSRALASRIAWRRVPGPVLLEFVTTNVAPPAPSQRSRNDATKQPSTTCKFIVMAIIR